MGADEGADGDRGWRCGVRIDEFLLARIAEDEAVARDATDDGHVWLLE